jgi:hypothetical protein
VDAAGGWCGVSPNIRSRKFWALAGPDAAAVAASPMRRPAAGRLRFIDGGLQNGRCPKNPRCVAN